jgi:hypothetical protein
MAVLAIFTGDVGKDDYDALVKEVKWKTELAPGGVFHAAGFDGAGKIHVADVWESQQALDNFVGQRLVPAFQKLKLAPPNVEVYTVHNIDAYSSIVNCS